MLYLTIKGTKQHDPKGQIEVDRAAEVLFADFGEYARPELTREYLSKPENVLIASDSALCILLGAGSEGQILWLMWVKPTARGKGLGSALLSYVLDTYASDHYLRLQCPAERVAFYQRHGFHVLFTADRGSYACMAGPAKNADEVQRLLPKSLRRRSGA